MSGYKWVYCFYCKYRLQLKRPGELIIKTRLFKIKCIQRIRKLVCHKIVFIIKGYAFYANYVYPYNGDHFTVILICVLTYEGEKDWIVFWMKPQKEKGGVKQYRHCMLYIDLVRYIIPRTLWTHIYVGRNTRGKKCLNYIESPVHAFICVWNYNAGRFNTFLYVWWSYMSLFCMSSAINMTA